ncbi:MAG TPA: insulinase family protein, partial [Gemmatimonadaceae bacterium]|nr:insulinase family protein [Gemmatimonadaceae bacterium]
MSRTVEMLSIRRFLSTLAIGAWVATVASAQSTGSTDHVLPADTAVRTGVLPNGLRYYVRHNGWPAHRAELRLVVNAGSVLEDDDQRGLAHFLEHVAFDGTTHFPKHALIHYLQSAGMTFGADVNAHTSFDETVYQLTVPTDSAAVLGQGLQILEDWAHNLTFDSAEIDRERRVVIEEWRLGRGAGARIGARADSAV